MEVTDLYPTNALKYRVFTGAELLAAFAAQDEAVTYAKNVKERMLSDMPVNVFRDNTCVVGPL